ncbi:putative uncharacterized protein [Firmicutes bacterium CAG:534]|nr:putative uncharacterized protein [Firmicutes bacterium CAG:534]
MITGRYANVIVDISHEKVDRPFQYKIPERLMGKLSPGMCVEIPFGNGSRFRQGYVIEVTDKPEYAPEKQKEIAGIVQGGVSMQADQIRLAAWIRETYGSTMIAALKTVLPVRQERKQKEKKKIVRCLGAEETMALLGQAQRKHQTAKVRVLEQLCREEILPYELVSGKLNVSPATLRSLESQGVIRVEAESYYRNPVKLNAEAEEGKQLSGEQSAVRDQVLSDYDQGKNKTYLIHGITGSGKTEVYLAIIEGMIKRGKQCIVLIPEIALTYQTLLRFYKRFGDRVSVMNSSLSAGEKYDQCERARKGEIDVIIGPRSALFVPFENLGLVVIDEEHEGSYKSESMPRYHARETARYLADLKGASLVLGSATPSLEAYYLAQKGEYELFRLGSRLTGGSLARVYIADLRQELREGNRSIFSRKLKELMEERLAKKEQMILFLNRRGYAGFVSCRSCGLVMKCPHCDVSLSKHMGGKLVCHYCGYETREPEKCPECGSPYIMGFKAGTQQIEQNLCKTFPGIRVLRMDGDTTRQKGSYERILSAFAEGEADVLLGTQMIVKGHDFPNVTLVGVLAADLSLNENDYRAGERTFQLLTQAVGRAGRGSKPGEAVIQTYRPDHYSIQWAAKQDYNAFYEEEILYREMAQYPPVSHMLAVLVTTENREEGWKLIQQLSELAGKAQGVSVIGPSEASIGKINDCYRFVVYCKASEYANLIRVKDEMEKHLDAPGRRTENVQFDFDPMDRY